MYRGPLVPLSIPLALPKFHNAPSLEKILKKCHASFGSIMVPVALKNINMNTKEKKPYDSMLSTE